MRLRTIDNKAPKLTYFVLTQAGPRTFSHFLNNITDSTITTKITTAITTTPTQSISTAKQPNPLEKPKLRQVVTSCAQVITARRQGKD